MTSPDLSQRLYRAFHDWRVRLFSMLAQLDTDHLQALAADLRATLARLDEELQRRRDQGARHEQA